MKKDTGLIMSLQRQILTIFRNACSERPDTLLQVGRNNTCRQLETCNGYKFNAEKSVGNAEVQLATMALHIVQIVENLA